MAHTQTALGQHSDSTRTDLGQISDSARTDLGQISDSAHTQTALGQHSDIVAQPYKAPAPAAAPAPIGSATHLCLATRTRSRFGLKVAFEAAVGVEEERICVDVRLRHVDLRRDGLNELTEACEGSRAVEAS